ncbi:efflux RND transporter permease subunit [Candidatus Sumerlaeota bacterium]|nr:efflux RND transporter permease subunit [Candidatus Sumerlaeota bacterium]
MKISDFALENRTSVFVFMFVIAVVGVYCYVVLPREAAPDIPVPFISITTPYEGVAPSDIETLITMKIEKELKALKSVKEIRSQSIEGLSSITVEFEPDVDIDVALQKVRDKVDIAKPELPADLDDEPAIGEFNFSEWPIIYVNITGGSDQAQLKYIADRIEDEIETIPGVLRVDQRGALEREIRLEFDPDRLAAYNINPYEAIEAIRQNNLNIPSGSLELGEANYVVKVPGEFQDPAEIDNIVISVRDGRPVYLFDVAKVVDGFAERLSYSRLNGKPSVTLEVVKRSGENIIFICDAVKILLERAEPMLPAGIGFSLTADMSKDIRTMVSDLENNILSGLVLIMTVIFLALGPRDSVLVGMAIPFSMFLSFAVIRFSGLTLNMIVLFSLTLSLGMMVDNAIVIVENVHRHHNLGLRRVTAAHVATAEVAWPITTSCLTTVAAFFPLLFWPGIMGEFMGFLPRTVIITLFASLFVALAMTPSVATRLLKKAVSPQHRRFADSRTLRVYDRLLRTALRFRWAVVVLAFGLLVVMVRWYGAKNLGTELFPDIEPRQAMIRLQLPEGASLEASDRIVRLAEAAAAKYPESKAIVANVGGGTGGDPFGGGANSANRSDVTIEFVDREFRKTPASQIIEKLREDLSDVSGADVRVDKPEEGPPTGAPISIEISGEDFETLGRLAAEVRERLKAIEGVVDIKDDFVTGKPELRIRIDKEKAALLGLTTDIVGQMLRTAIQGTKAGVFRVGNDEYDVVVRMPKPRRQEIDALERIRIPNLYGKQIPLTSVAEFEWGSGLGSVNRVDDRRTVTVSAQVAKGFNENAVLETAKAVLAEHPLPHTYMMRFTGQNEEQNESQAFLSKSFVIAIFLIAVILVMQFDSVILPFIILASVILSLIGVFFGLVVTNRPFGIIMTGIGVISLAGVVVNNAIVLIDYTEKLRARGLELMDAVITAAKTRFRPVMLTAITTILGLIPMATGVSFDFRKFHFNFDTESTEWWSSMAVAVIYGLGVATLLTLVVVPSLYVILAPIRGKSTHVQRMEEEAEAAAASASGSDG